MPTTPIPSELQGYPEQGVYGVTDEHGVGRSRLGQCAGVQHCVRPAVYGRQRAGAIQVVRQPLTYGGQHLAACRDGVPHADAAGLGSNSTSIGRGSTGRGRDVGTGAVGTRRSIGVGTGGILEADTGRGAYGASGIGSVSDAGTSRSIDVSTSIGRGRDVGTSRGIGVGTGGVLGLGTSGGIGTGRGIPRY